MFRGMMARTEKEQWNGIRKGVCDMSSKGNEKREFPKNIRQIGEAGKEKRVYLEDYAITYIRQVQGAILLGETAKIRGIRCWFINAAIEIPEGNFQEENWKHVCEEAEKNFPELSVVGWFLKAEEIPEELNEEDMQIYREHFQGREAILVVYNDLEKEEGVYLTLDGFLRKQEGYFIYYEKNQKMQEYLVTKNEGKSVEKEAVVPDQAIQSFRKIIENKKPKKEESIPETPKADIPKIKQKEDVGQPKIKTLHFLYTASTFLVLTILVIGVTMINNYDKMKEMEETMARMTENMQVSGTVVSVEETESEEIPMKETIIDVRTGETEILNGILTESEMSTETETDVTEANATVTESGILDEASVVSSEAEPVVSVEAETASYEASAPVHVSQASYTIKFGDTLADICSRYYGTTEKLQEICDLNNIEDPNSIMPGQKLVLP